MARFMVFADSSMRRLRAPDVDTAKRAVKDAGYTIDKVEYIGKDEWAIYTMPKMSARDDGYLYRAALPSLKGLDMSANTKVVLGSLAAIGALYFYTRR